MDIIRGFIPGFCRAILAVSLWVSVGTSCSYAETTRWPTESWPTSTPEAQGMESRLLANMLEGIDVFEARIDSVTIIRNGYMVLDAYFHPFQKGRRHRIYSCTKSVTSALIGIAIRQGLIPGVQTPVLDFFPERQIDNLDSRKKALTLEHLLTMTTGLDCRDTWRDKRVGLYAMKGSSDWTQYMLDRPMKEQPGRRFEYCNGASFLLTAILERATGMNALAYARKHLFAPLGIDDVTWATSPRGINTGYSRMWLRPQDMAKIGWLYLNKGRWDDRQVVPASWVERSTQARVEAAGVFPHYGYQWWVDADGIYSALGYRGQYILVVPKYNLVAVFTGDLSRSNIGAPLRLLQKSVIGAIKSGNPLPEKRKHQARIAALITKYSTAPKGGDVWTTPQKKRKHQARIAALITKYSAAPKGGDVWTTPQNGTAKNGQFVRRAVPALQISYPRGSRKLPTRFKAQFMSMKSPGDTFSGATFFSGSILEIPKDVPLSEVGPKTYVALLTRYVRNISVVSNNPLTLSDGSKAYLTTLRWSSRGLPNRSAVVSAFREGKWVFVRASAFGDLVEAKKIVSSLTFKAPQ